LTDNSGGFVVKKLGIIPEPKIAGSRDGASTQERFKGLFRNVSSSYNSMETMFQQAGVPPPTLTGNRKINMEMRCDGDVPRMCLQIVESRKMPFGFLHVGEQAWKFLSAGKGTDPNVGGFEMVGPARSCCSAFIAFELTTCGVVRAGVPKPR
jgi:hypothetical protein